MAEPTATIRVRRDTREQINELAKCAGVSAPELVGRLVEQARSDALFAEHAAAYARLRESNPALLAEIEAEDSAWDRTDLARAQGNRGG
jgi:hypothetical protein